MGSTSSKFRKHLQNGDEYAALQVFQSNPELRKSVDPNSSYGDSLHHNSPLHLAAKHAMKPLLRIFLNELGGNPNKRNAFNETALHLACQGNIMRSPSTQERRAACAWLILQWKAPSVEGREPERIVLSAVDERGNTALHYAATTGLKRCVELLIRNGAPLFLENHNKDTACDLAEKSGHEEIAILLESNMVFSPELCTDVSEVDVVIDTLEESSGLRPQDLQEAKDQLLVETSDMLHIPLFTAEALLRTHEWSRESLLEEWMKDPIECCHKAGVQPPSSALQYANNSIQISCSQIQEEYQNESLNSPARISPMKDKLVFFYCGICTGYAPFGEEPVVVPCKHQFCRSCWAGYLTVKIQDGDAHSIMCPEFECQQLVPIDVIEKLVSPDMVRRYLQFDIEAFVESNPNIKWCPYPGCSRAVKLPESETMFEVVTIPNTQPPAPVSHAVDCGNGHYFCWECLGEAHAPCGCDKWREWHGKIAEIKPEELRNTSNKTEDAANCLWLVTNSKPCPNCKSPIQKNEGCNHMKCSKCKHDFCWVCLEGWKKHSSGTGGYFRCNRYDAVHRAEERAGLLISEAEVRNKEMQELKRFVHYYTRFRNHENSHKLEEPLLEVAREKMRMLVTSVQEPIDLETHFLEEAVKELLRSRRVLCGSYVYGYYLEDNGYNKTIFEFMQNDLEEVTERLSEMVARHYLRNPRVKIVHTAVQVRQKRQEFITAVSKGLIPPETPPSLRRNRKKRYPGVMGMDPIEDEQLTQAIMSSLQDVDPNNPWVKDAQGKHANLTAMFDWPDYDSDEESGTNNALTTSILGVCSRQGCLKPRARNPRTGSIQEYCSLRCYQTEQSGDEDMTPAFEVDYSMDMLIALEMSRLQMIEDMQRIQKTKSDDRSTTDGEQAEEANPNEEPSTSDAGKWDSVVAESSVAQSTSDVPESEAHKAAEVAKPLEESPLLQAFQTVTTAVIEQHDFTNEAVGVTNQGTSTEATTAGDGDNSAKVDGEGDDVENIAFFLKTSLGEDTSACNFTVNIFDKTQKELFNK